MTVSFDMRTQAEEAYAAAAAAIADQQCVVMPTDTVYGIAAGAFSAEAVGALLAAKKRGADMPSPVLIAEPAMLPALATAVPTSAAKLAEEFWPGPLTLILKAHKTLRLQLGETGGTVAVRVPDSDYAREVLRRTGPLAVSSANLSGQAAATTCQQAEESLGESVAVYLDGGPTGGITPSTIVDFSSQDNGRLLREGVVTTPQLLELCPDLET